MPESPTDPRPGYKEPWVWLVFGLPLTAVIAGITTVFIAYSNPPDLVPGHWKKDGKAIVELFDTMQTSIDMNLSAMGSFENDNVVIRLNQQVDSNSVHMNFVHPTQGEKDQQTTLHKIGKMEYSGFLPSLSAGQYKVILESNPQNAETLWMLTGTMSWPTDQLHLQP